MIRLFKISDRVLKLLIRGTTAVHQGLWLGALSDAQLQRLTEDFYDNAARYADPGFNTSGLNDWEARLIARYFEAGSRILVAAAGGGREVVALRRDGFSADGFDCNERYAREGQRLLEEKGMGGALVFSPPGTVPGTLGTYDAAIVGWGGYMHIRGRRPRIRFLEDLAGHLREDAPLVVSVFHWSALSRVHHAAARIANVIRSISGREAIDPGDTINGSFDHIFTSEELSRELVEAGFQVEHFERVGEGYGVAVARLRSSATRRAGTA